MRLPMPLVPPAVCDIRSNRAGGKKWQKASRWRMASSLIPQLPARESSALDQRLQLGPHDRGMNAAIEGALRKAAVGARHHVLAPQEIGEAQDALGDKLGVLDHIGDVADHAGDQHLARRQFHVPPYLPFMLVAGV